MRDDDGYINEEIPWSINIKVFYVEVSSLKTSLPHIGFKSGFFLPTNEDEPDFMKLRHLQYSHTLPATVTA